jgi:uncharacterized protein (DUF305 family)
MPAYRNGKSGQHGKRECRIDTRLGGAETEALTLEGESPVRIALRAGAAGCLLALSFGAAACDSGGAATPAPPPASASAFFGGTDLAWVEINIAMNEQLLPLLELVPAQSADPGVRKLAAEVKAANEQELATLRALHDQAKLPSENPHKGMPMPGMVTPEQVTAAGKVKGAAFDKLFKEQLAAHFKQGKQLAESERKAGIEPQTLALADRVLSTRDKYLPTL